MTKTLAELRAEKAGKPATRPQRTVTLCLAPEIMAEVTLLTAEHDRLVTDPSPGDTDAAPQRLAGAKKSARAKEIRARLAELSEQMSEYEGEMVLRANLTDGDWRNWTNAHPARAEGQPGYDRDQRVTLAYCDADALIDNLGAFLHTWNSEPVTAADWADWMEAQVGTAEKADMATRVIELYESRLDFQRLRTGLSRNLKRWSASDSRETSESATSDSTAGSPSESTEATTEQESA